MSPITENHWLVEWHSAQFLNCSTKTSLGSQLVLVDCGNDQTEVLRSSLHLFCLGLCGFAVCSRNQETYSQGGSPTGKINITLNKATFPFRSFQLSCSNRRGFWSTDSQWCLVPVSCRIMAAISAFRPLLSQTPKSCVCVSFLHLDVFIEVNGSFFTKLCPYMWRSFLEQIVFLPPGKWCPNLAVKDISTFVVRLHRWTPPNGPMNT